jgi:hypothetical protein
VISFEIDEKSIGILELVGKAPLLPKGGAAEGALFITVDASELKEYKTNIKVNIVGEEGVLTTAKTTFLGPIR